MPWFRPHFIELEITPLVRPGQRNQITLRVFNNSDVFGASGLYECMFIYARTRISGKPPRTAQHSSLNRALPGSIPVGHAD
jgi:hypothetical protein